MCSGENKPNVWFELFRDDPDSQMVEKTKKFCRKCIKTGTVVAVIGCCPKTREIYYRHGPSRELFKRNGPGDWNYDRVYGKSMPFKLYSIPMPDASLDAVFLWEITGHVSEPQRLLHEVHRVLRSDGRMFIKAVNVTHPGVILHSNLIKFRQWLFSESAEDGIEWYAYKLNSRGGISISMHELGYIKHEVLVVEDPQARVYFNKILAAWRRRYEDTKENIKKYQWMRPTILGRCKKIAELKVSTINTKP